MSLDGEVGVELTERRGAKPRPPRLDDDPGSGSREERAPPSSHDSASETFDRLAGRNQLELAPDSKWRKVRATVKAAIAFSRVLREHVDYGNDAVDSEDEEAWSERFKSSRIIGVKPWWVMLPSHPFRRVWEPTMVIPLLYVAVVAPIRIFFQPKVEPWMDILDWAVTAAFWVDIVVNFCSSFVEEATDRIVVDPWRIAKRYLFGWFVVDLVASIPLDVIITDDSAGAVNDLGKLARLPRSLRLLRLLRLLRALRLVHLQGHLRRVERSSDMHPAIARIFMITFWAFVLLHFSGSIWWFIGAESDASGMDSWVADQGLNTGDVALGKQYLASVYFVVATLTSTGYGEIIAINEWERVFTSFMMLLGLAWAGVVVSSVNTVMMNFDRQSFDVRQKMLLLDSFMRSARLPRTLKRRVSNHLESVARGEQARANAATTRQVLDMLSPALRQEVVLFTNRRQLQLVPLLQDERHEVQSAVLELLSRQVSSRGDYVSVEGTYASSIFFLTSGRANVLQGGDRIASLGSGSYFGLIDCLFSSLRLLSVQAVTDCELYSLRREDLMTVLGQFPEFALRLKRRALARLTKFRERVGRDVVEPQFLEQMQHFGIGLSSAIVESPSGPAAGLFGPGGELASGSEGFAPLSPQPGPGGERHRRRRRRGSIEFVTAAAPASRGKADADVTSLTEGGASDGPAGLLDGDQDAKAAGRGAAYGFRRGSAGGGAPHVVRRTSGRVPSHRSFASGGASGGGGGAGFFGLGRLASSRSARSSAAAAFGHGPHPDNRPLSLEERLSRAKAAARAMGDLPPGRIPPPRLPAPSPPTSAPGFAGRDGGRGEGRRSDDGGAGGDVRTAASAPGGERRSERRETASDESDPGHHDVRSWRDDDEDDLETTARSTAAGGAGEGPAEAPDVVGDLTAWGGGGFAGGGAQRPLPRLASAPGRHMWPAPGDRHSGEGGAPSGLSQRVAELARRVGAAEVTAASHRASLGAEVEAVRRQTEAILEAVRALGQSS